MLDDRPSPTRSVTPQTTVLIDSQRSSAISTMAELWHARELLGFLVWRDLKVRYKQSLLGATWAVLRPLSTALVFTLVFAHLARVPSEGMPYPLFAYAALLPWTFFSSAVARGSESVVASSPLVTKTYVPRLALPLASVLVIMGDFLFATVAITPMMLWYGVTPSLGLFCLPLFFGIALVAALGLACGLSAIDVRFRDVRHLVPVALQLGLFLSPVVYPTALVADALQARGIDGWLYGLNPLVGPIEGFRWAFAGAPPPEGALLAASAVSAGVLFLVGVLVFRASEDAFADYL